MKILAVIPARGGSKSVPLKNIHALDGRPLIEYTIKAVKKSILVTRCIVSTDHPEIARVSRNAGAEVPFLRPIEHSADATEDLPVLRHALDWLKNHEGYEPDIVLRLPPTSPLRRPRHIDAACRLLLKNPKADSVRSVCEAPKHPLKMWRIGQGRLSPFVPFAVYKIREPYNKPRQKLPPAYFQNGAVEAIWAKTIFKKKSMSGDTILPLVMEPEYSVNIDGLMDFAWAEFLLKSNRKNKIPGGGK